MMQQPDIGGMILAHTADSHVLEFDFRFLGLGLHEIDLPTGWYLFGIDVSPTKHVVYMAFAALLVFLTMWWGGRQVARRHREGKAPSGFGGTVEALVLFVRNDVAIANIGHGGEKFAPFILTLFFFILYCNLLGLLPWGATATGNLAVTGGLALLAFLTIEGSGMAALGPKGYLKTIVMVPPGMTGFGAVIMAMIMTPVELIGKIVKPFALCLRLFANMTGRPDLRVRQLARRGRDGAVRAVHAVSRAAGGVPAGLYLCAAHVRVHRAHAARTLERHLTRGSTCTTCFCCSRT